MHNCCRTLTEYVWTCVRLCLIQTTSDFDGCKFSDRDEHTCVRNMCVFDNCTACTHRLIRQPVRAHICWMPQCLLTYIFHLYNSPIYFIVVNDGCHSLFYFQMICMIASQSGTSWQNTCRLCVSVPNTACENQMVFSTMAEGIQAAACGLGVGNQG